MASRQRNGNRRTNSNRRTNRFVRHVGGERTSKLYKWAPQVDAQKNINTTNRKHFCTATGGVQGEDWIVTYVYEVINDNGIARRIAYVECGYVE